MTTRVRDIQGRFLRSRGYRSSFSKRNGWVWRKRGAGTGTRQEVFRAEFANSSTTVRRQLRQRLATAV
jgi:hypothetical protein